MKFTIKRHNATLFRGTEAECTEWIKNNGTGTFQLDDSMFKQAMREEICPLPDQYRLYFKYDWDEMYADYKSWCYEEYDCQPPSHQAWLEDTLEAILDDLILGTPVDLSSIAARLWPEK